MKENLYVSIPNSNEHFKINRAYHQSAKHQNTYSTIPTYIANRDSILVQKVRVLFYVSSMVHECESIQPIRHTHTVKDKNEMCGNVWHVTMYIVFCTQHVYTNIYTGPIQIKLKIKKRGKILKVKEINQHKRMVDGECQNHGSHIDIHMDIPVKCNVEQNRMRFHRGNFLLRFFGILLRIMMMWFGLYSYFLRWKLAMGGISQIYIATVTTTMTIIWKWLLSWGIGYVEMWILGTS